MRNIKVFDVVELNNKERGTILKVDADECLIEIAGNHKFINKQEINDIIYRNKGLEN